MNSSKYDVSDKHHCQHGLETETIMRALDAILQDS